MRIISLLYGTSLLSVSTFIVSSLFLTSSYGKVTQLNQIIYYKMEWQQAETTSFMWMNYVYYILRIHKKKKKHTWQIYYTYIDTRIETKKKSLYALEKCDYHLIRLQLNNIVYKKKEKKHMKNISIYIDFERTCVGMKK